MTPEFSLIEKFFTRSSSSAALAVLGVGDDCALVNVSTGQSLAISTDTLVSGVHFFPDVAPEKLGHKCLAVNLSDIAAMGATPRYFTLALTLPTIDEPWLAKFAEGLWRVADEYALELIGGDTTRGPLSITISIFGEVPAPVALRRDGAKAGDDVWVSGSLGLAAAGLWHLQGKIALSPDASAMALPHLESPTPRVALGMALRGIATAAIDVSDGLIADLGHLCRRSRLAATLNWPLFAVSTALEALSETEKRHAVLAGGDDYELCFTAAPHARADVLKLGEQCGVLLTRIGALHACEPTDAPVTVRDADGAEIELSHAGFDHFAECAK